MSFPLTGRDTASRPGPGPGSQFTAESILDDYRVAFRSRQASLIGRREVLTGKAKFGIFGDGKEVAQLALARAFRQGDFRSGYYRDQTLMFALGAAHARAVLRPALRARRPRAPSPASAGRGMNAHFATRMLDADGQLRTISPSCYNSSADVSPTGSQMPRLVGLAYASKLYRELPELHELHASSRTTATRSPSARSATRSCAEGDVLGVGQRRRRAAGADAALDLGRRLRHLGAERAPDHQGEHLGAARRLPPRTPEQQPGLRPLRGQRLGLPGALRDLPSAVAGSCAREHVPAIVHVDRADPAAGALDLRQPRALQVQGAAGTGRPSSTAIAQDARVDRRRRGSPPTAELDDGRGARTCAIVARRSAAAWDAYRAPIDAEDAERARMLDELAARAPRSAARGRGDRAHELDTPARSRCAATSRSPLHGALIATARRGPPAARRILAWKRGAGPRQRRALRLAALQRDRASALKVARRRRPTTRADAPVVNGFEVLNACFDAALARDAAA